MTGGEKGRRGRVLLYEAQSLNNILGIWVCVVAYLLLLQWKPLRIGEGPLFGRVTTPNNSLLVLYCPYSRLCLAIQ